MGIATTLKNHLRTKNIDFSVLKHPYSEGSINTAIAANIPPKQLAKAVLFRDEDFHYTLAVIPASNKVKRYTINQIFDCHFEMASEEEIDFVFSDCQQGAIPPIGQAYNINVIWDEELISAEYIWIEAGDHQSLIQLDVKNFGKLMKHIHSDHFSTHLRYRRPPRMPQQHYQWGIDL